MLTRLFGNKYHNFWTWFIKHSDEFFHLDENNVEPLFKSLSKQLAKINRDLTFEFSVELIDGKREFIISADGIYSTFPDVINLVEAAPKLDHFIITAFRQRGKEFTIQYNEVELDPADIFFSYEAYSGDQIDIVLYIKGYTDNQDLDGAVFILLDTLIGEYDVATKIRHIDFLPFEENLTIKPILELPDIVDHI
ncbi:hypothetical protein [Metabacillus sediminilitoris]|uniref:DUF695 domain-containing protein n=1 Tax=Metabacillus sediminilitoris TaxID=2567941 RepID=A0A4S4C3D0_9BACI|nr:hypothetical protein [Metabacillus sediminilitoris]QGQ44494.1 hypothetical protein GMB29_04000 [Metabacillus sediminilitoris]THF80117.1 hypothetical protein E6W99_10615 [Metabacillus sediminilitoris]